MAVPIRLYLQGQLEHETVRQYWFTSSLLMMSYSISLSLPSNLASKAFYHQFLYPTLFLGHRAGSSRGGVAREYNGLSLQ